MREELLAIIEKNSRIPLEELASMLGTAEDKVITEMAALEKEGDRKSTRLNSSH